MEQSKALAQRTGEGSGAEDGPPPPFRSWQAPPDGLFDVIVPTLTAKQFVVVQLVCKDWSRSARDCLKNATPKRPDVDLSKLAKLYPNLTQLDLTHVEGLTTRMLGPLRQMTALRELCLSNIALKQQYTSTINVDAGVQYAAAAPVAQVWGPGEGGKAAAAAKTTTAEARVGSQPPVQTRNRWRARSGAKFALGPARAAGQTRITTGRGADRDGDEDTSKGSPSACDSPPSKPQLKQPKDTEGRAAAPASMPPVMDAAGGAGGGDASSGDAAGSAAAVSPGSPQPPLSPASRIFGGLGDVLVRLSTLQADLCPALTADAIACLPNLTDLTLDTLIAPEALVPLRRLRSLAVKKLANAEALERLTGLTALLVNSDISCASEFLPACTRLPELQSLTFKTSSTKVLQQPDLLYWQGFSRLSSLDLRAPAECLKPGLPALAELAALRSLSLDLYCASDEELMVTVVAPPNLESLFLSSDRSRSGGVIDVQPNPRLRSMRLRLYWTALNLVLSEGVPEPSPLPEPLSEDLESEPRPTQQHRQNPGSSPARGAVVRRLAVTAAEERTVGAGGGTGAQIDAATTMNRQSPRGAEADVAGDAVAVADGELRPCGRGLRRRRSSDASPRPVGGSGGRAVAGGGDVNTVSPERGPRRRVMKAGGGSGAAAAAAAVAPSSGGRGTTAVATVAGNSSQDDSAGVAGGSDGGSSGEEVGFRGAGPSTVAPYVTTAAAATAPATNATGCGDESENKDKIVKKADADFRRHPTSFAGADAAVGAEAVGGGSPANEPQAHQREGTPRASPLSAVAPVFVTELPLPDRRRSGSAAAAGGQQPQGNRSSEVMPHANLHAAAATPRLDCRCRCSGGGGSASCGDSAAAATPSLSVGAPGSAGGGDRVMPLLELEELCLDACFFLLYGSLVPLLRQFPRLRKLTLDNCLALENGELKQLCELSGLRELSLSGLHLVTDAGLRWLGHLPRLASLRVKGLRKLSVHAAQAYVRQKPFVRRHEEISGSFLTSLAGLSELRSLALKHLHTARESALEAGLSDLTHLTRLEVKDVHSMSDKVLLALTGLTRLQDLSVLHCESVTSVGRGAVVACLGHRLALDFEGCSLLDITRPCALPTVSTQAQLIDDDQASSSNQPPQSYQHSNQH